MAEKVLCEANGCLVSNVVGAPKGEYRIISYDLEMTGRRSIDEICQITAFFPEEGGNFAQYVMPHLNPNPESQRRNNICVVTAGRTRVLKHATTGEFLHSKTEVSALADFLAWLERSRAKDGVILMSYEPHPMFSNILLQSMAKYNMTETFCSVVKGFANAFYIAQKKLTVPVNLYSLSSVAQTLEGNEKGTDIVTSLDRNRAAMEVIRHICRSDPVPDLKEGGGTDILGVVLEFTHTIEDETTSLKELKELRQRQSTCRRIFSRVKNRRDKQHASVQKHLIKQTGLDYPTLSAIFQADGSDGIAKTVNEKLVPVFANMEKELVMLLVDHFNLPPKTGSLASYPSGKRKGESNESNANGASPSAGSSKDPAPLGLESRFTASQSAMITAKGKSSQGGKEEKQKDPGESKRTAEKKEVRFVVAEAELK